MLDLLFLKTNQSAPRAIVSEHSFPKHPKSALRILGAMKAGGAMPGRCSDLYGKGGKLRVFVEMELKVSQLRWQSGT